MTNINDRIVLLSEQYSSQKKFLEKCGIKNQSYLSDIKSGRNKNPSANILERIVENTGCSGTWLLTGKGQMFDEEKDFDDEYDTLIAALKAVERVENNTVVSSDTEQNMDVQRELVQLLLKLLERQKS